MPARKTALLLSASCLLSTACSLLATSACVAGDWPCFRGPNGTGVAEDKNVPVQWSEKNILWKTPLPGIGNSSPVISGDHVFLETTNADASARHLVCLSATDGHLLWTATVPGGKATIHKKSSWASSTPATDGERVYGAFWDGHNQSLLAYDFQGHELWRRDLGKFTSQHGAGCSPVVVGDKVIFANDQDGSAVLLAFDAKTGKDAWQAQRTPFRACYSTPFLLEEKGREPQLIVASTAGITSYDPKNGDEHWSFTWKFRTKPLRTVASPLAWQGMIFATSGDGDGSRHAIAIKAGDKGDVSKTNLVWQNSAELPYVPSMLVRGDHLYFVNDDGLAGCLEAKTGKIIWKERVAAGVSASPLLIDGKIYIVGEDGETTVLAAEPEYKELAKNALNDPVMATPAVAGGHLFIRSKSYLYCIGQK